MATTRNRGEIRVGIAGLGAIGQALARRLLEGVPGLRLTCVGVRDPDKKRPPIAAVPGVVVTDSASLRGHADVIVECAPAEAFRSIAEPALSAGRQLMIMSCGALLFNEDLVELARTHGAQIIVPTGALIGLDAMTAAAEGQIESVRMITRKPVAGLLGAPYLEQHGIRIDNLREPLRVFRGSARQAAAGFPANLNVAVALSLAGIGPDRTEVEIWADPALKRNTHRIEVEAEAARFSMSIENVPSENPRTGRITALSVVAALRKMTAPLRVGT